MAEANQEAVDRTAMVQEMGGINERIGINERTGTANLLNSRVRNSRSKDFLKWPPRALVSSADPIKILSKTKMMSSFRPTSLVKTASAQASGSKERRETQRADHSLRQSIPSTIFHQKKPESSPSLKN